jgi:hypothetical protein
VELPDPLPEELAEPFVDIVGSSGPAAVRSWLADYASRAPVLDTAGSLSLCRERVCEWLDAKEANEILVASRVFICAQLDLGEHALGASMQLARRLVDHAVVKRAVRRKKADEDVYRASVDTVVDAPAAAHATWADMAFYLANGRGRVSPQTALLDTWQVMWVVSAMLVATQGPKGARAPGATRPAALSGPLSSLDIAVPGTVGERPGDPAPGEKVRVPGGARVYSEAPGWPSRGKPIERARVVTVRAMGGHPEAPEVVWKGTGGYTYWSRKWEQAHGGSRACS